MARTSPSHGGNRGSTPRRVTKLMNKMRSIGDYNFVDPTGSRKTEAVYKTSGASACR